MRKKEGHSDFIATARSYLWLESLLWGFPITVLEQSIPSIMSGLGVCLKMRVSFKWQTREVPFWFYSDFKICQHQNFKNPYGRINTQVTTQKMA